MLLAVLASPPLTSGQRTLARVALATEALGFEAYTVANLFDIATRSTGDIALLGASEEGWLGARHGLTSHLERATGVLLAYGTQPPTGPARHHFHHQVAWVRAAIADRGLPTWWVGSGPRHPSRWQRWTCRAFPDLSFVDALVGSLELVRHRSDPASQAPD